MIGYDRLKKFLSNEGFSINEHSNSLTFDYQGYHYMGMKNSDSPYIQLVLIITADKVDMDRRLDICNEINDNRLCAKLTCDEDSIWCNYEFLTNEYTLDDYFGEGLDVIYRAATEVFKKLQQ